AGGWDAVAPEDCGGDVGDPAARAQPAAAVPAEDHGDRAGGVRGERRAVTRVDLVLRVAVVGGDEHRPAGGERGVGDLAQAAVDDLDRGDGGGEVTGVADHVGVGEVHHDERVAAGAQPVEDRLGHRLGAHRRHQV